MLQCTFTGTYENFSNCDFKLLCLFSDIMANMGYSRKDVEESLSQNKYDDITATYLLLGRRTAMVSDPCSTTMSY